MSKLTEVLKLLCYDPETDGNLTFNVTEALTKNWEKIDQLVLLAVAAAAAYDPEGSYAVGDYCTHGGGLHKCNTAIPDGEAWNAAHWTATTVAAELAEVRASLSTKAGTIGILQSQADLNTITNLGFYYSTDSMAPDIINSPITTGFHLYVLRPDRDSDDSQQRILQILTSTGISDANAAIWYRKHTGSGWSVWRSFLTATPPQEYDAVLANGFTNIQQCKYYKNQMDEVHLHVAIEATSSHSDGAIIATLPEGFRPPYTVESAAVLKNKDMTGTIKIQSNGNVLVYNTGGMNSGQTLFGDLNFISAT